MLLWGAELPGLSRWRESRECSSSGGEEAEGSISEEGNRQRTDHGKFAKMSSRKRIK